MRYYINLIKFASCDHQKSKLRTVAGAEGFGVAGLWVRQLKIGSKSCFGADYAPHTTASPPRIQKAIYISERAGAQTLATIHIYLKKASKLVKWSRCVWG